MSGTFLRGRSSTVLSFSFVPDGQTHSSIDAWEFSDTRPRADDRPRRRQGSFDVHFQELHAAPPAPTNFNFASPSTQMARPLADASFSKRPHALGRALESTVTSTISCTNSTLFSSSLRHCRYAIPFYAMELPNCVHLTITSKATLPNAKGSVHFLWKVKYVFLLCQRHDHDIRRHQTPR